MIDFVSAVTDPSSPFLLYALLTGIASSIAFGMMGSFVVIKKISYIAGAISHCTLGGIGLGIYLNKVHSITWFTPMVGAIIVSLISAIIIGLFSLRFKEREDTLIGSLWALGMGAGLILIDMTPGYSNAMSYLFGSILMVTKSDLWIVLSLDIVIVTATILFYNKLVALCFDEEFARLRGVNTSLLYILLLCLIALTIVLLVSIVGIVMIIALLTIPAAIASIWAKNIRQLILLSTTICLLITVFGLAGSYSYDLPSGPTIIVFGAMIYLIATLIFKRNKYAKK